MTEYVAIALSGGVDSLVAAALLKEQGFQLVGIHFITGFESGFHRSPGAAIASASLDALKDQALKRLTPMAEQLRIPLHIVNLQSEFQSKVVDYFTLTYQRGKTPNPCLVCNQLIKFDILLKQARKLGAGQLATGHYARIVADKAGHMHLFRGVDPVKEQSYFLSRLSQDQLRCALFPLGQFRKSQTRQMAVKRGLSAVEQIESQDICFIRNGTYGEFLSQQPGFSFSPGIIEDLGGQPIGRHNGLHLFTIGQRKGINCPAAEPYYVIRIDAHRNTLVVGTKAQLQTQECIVEQINWIATAPETPIDVFVRVRYRHQAVPARLIPTKKHKALILFNAPQTAVTPGQGAVFYLENEVLGAGWIQ